MPVKTHMLEVFVAIYNLTPSSHPVTNCLLICLLSLCFCPYIESEISYLCRDDLTTIIPAVCLQCISPLLSQLLYETFWFIPPGVIFHCSLLFPLFPEFTIFQIRLYLHLNGCLFDMPREWVAHTNAPRGKWENRLDLWADR